MRGSSVAPPTQEVDCVIVLGEWWNGTDTVVSILILLFVIGSVCGLWVGFQWSLKNLLSYPRVIGWYKLLWVPLMCLTFCH